MTSCRWRRARPTKRLEVKSLHLGRSARRSSLDKTTIATGSSPRMQWFKTSLGRLRVIGWWEGISFLLLLGIAMPLKYFADWPQAVRVVGMAHGVLFLLYVWAAIQAALERNWTWKRTALVLVASLLPAGPFVVDAKLLRPEEAEGLSNRR